MLTKYLLHYSSFLTLVQSLTVLIIPFFSCFSLTALATAHNWLNSFISIKTSSVQGSSSLFSVIAYILSVSRAPFNGLYSSQFTHLELSPYPYQIASSLLFQTQTQNSPLNHIYLIASHRVYTPAPLRPLSRRCKPPSRIFYPLAVKPP